MDSTSEGFITHKFDLTKIAQTRASWGVFRDRRPDLYGRLLTLDGNNYGANTIANQASLSASQRTATSTTHTPLTTPSSSMKPTSEVSHTQHAYYMPAEWNRHSATWMGFPSNKGNWCQDAQPAQERFIALARCIAEHEPVNMIVSGADYAKASSLLGGGGGSGDSGDGTRFGVRLIEMSSNDGVWLRDQAPMFVVDKLSQVKAGVCWKFDAWGRACYDDFTHDALIRCVSHLSLSLSL